MKRSFVLIALILASIHVFAHYDLHQLQEKARNNYPQIKQLGWIEEATGYNLENASKSWYPQLTVSGKATYQSDAINLSLNLPGGAVGMHQSKDQYQLVAEIQQQLWDGGATAARQKMLKSSSVVENQKIEVDLYSLKDRVNQLYFGILLLDEQEKQATILKSEWNTNLEKLSACHVNGVANQSDIDLIRVEILHADQKLTEIKASRIAYQRMLKSMAGIPQSMDLTLSEPQYNNDTSADDSNRPEIRLLNAQLDLLDNQYQMETAQILPKFGLFLQGGYGKPGLNMLNDAFSPFYIGGLRFSWNVGSLYNHQNNKALIENSKQQVKTAIETFQYNNRLKISQQNTEFEKVHTLLNEDEKILELRTSIKKNCMSRLENGVATVTDLIREINAENLAKQQISYHKIQLLLIRENINFSTNHP